MEQSYGPNKALELLHERRVFVAVAGPQIVGTASLDKHVIRTVFVAPELQGHGIGRLLMTELEKAARENGIDILVVPSSVTAETFYTKLGFKAVHDSFFNQERTIIMERHLAQAPR